MADQLNPFKQDLNERLEGCDLTMQIMEAAVLSRCPNLIPGQGMQHTSVIVLFHMSQAQKAL